MPGQLEASKRPLDDFNLDVRVILLREVINKDLRIEDNAERLLKLLPGIFLTQILQISARDLCLSIL